jgi:aspartyl-tRNA(Asn)/glutamyl-tRNA(Gln) amidotransferase subunit A
MRGRELTIAEAVRLVKRGELDPKEIAASCLDLIRRYDGRFRAFITVFEKPLRKGGKRGPLAGAVISVKDLIHVKGYPTTAGSVAFRDNVASENATVVERLLNASATLIGKNNLHELTFGITGFNPHFGTAVNPWKEDRYPGGSTSGGAVAVATGMSLGAIGTDTGGSVRVPASLCGLVGYKPTYGLISRHGVMPLSWTIDTVGVITRTVEDAALLASSLMGPDGKDLSVAVRKAPKLHPLRPRRLRGTVLGVPRKHFCELLEEDVRRSFDGLLGRLESEGARIVEVEVPEVRLMRFARSVISHVEFAAVYGRLLRERPQDVSEELRERGLQGLLTPGPVYVNALRLIPKLTSAFRSLFSEVDALLMPTTIVTAPKVDQQTVNVDGEVLDVRSALLRNVEPFNLVGAPAVSVPCGLSREGLPIGVQVVGDVFDDRTVLSVAMAVERLVGGIGLPPLP